MPTQRELERQIVTKGLERGMTPDRIKEAVTAYRSQSGVAPKPQPVPYAIPEKQAVFPAKVGQDSAIQASGKMLGNIVPDALSFGWDIVKSLNPVSNIKTIASNVKELATGIPELVREAGGAKQAAGAFAKEVPGTAYKALVPQAIQQGIAGDFEGAQKTIVENPVRTIAPLIFATRAGAKALGKGQQFDAGISKMASPVTKPVGAAITAVKAGIKKATVGAAKYGAAQASGLSTKTIETITKDPKAFSRAEKSGLARPELAEKVGKTIKGRLQKLSDTGEGYEAIRKSGYPVTIPKGTIEGVLSKYNIRIKNGKVVVNAETPPLSSGDISAIEHFYGQYGKQTTLSPNAFLNSRKALDNLAKWDAAKTDLSKVIARDLRSSYDTIGKNQITPTTTSPGLEALDKKYAPEVAALKVLRKDFLNPDGSLKDGAANKIANLTGEGKTQALGRLEKLSPGITKEINIVKAMEDIQATHGQKVGTYVRGAVLGGGILTGNPLAIIAAVISSPSVFVPILKAFGNSKGINVMPTINRVTNGLKLTPYDTALIISAAQAQSQLKSTPSGGTEPGQSR